MGRHSMNITLPAKGLLSGAIAAMLLAALPLEDARADEFAFSTYGLGVRPSEPASRRPREHMSAWYPPTTRATSAAR